MNIFKKVESFLEDVDQQAASTLQRPNELLSNFELKGRKNTPKTTVGDLKEMGVSTDQLDLDFDPELNLSAPASPLPSSSSTPDLTAAGNADHAELGEPGLASTEGEGNDEVAAGKRKEQKQIAALQIKLRSSEQHIALLEAQQSELLGRYKSFQSVYQKQRTHLMETLASQATLKEEKQQLQDKSNELEQALSTETQLHSNLQLRFKQKTDECEMAQEEVAKLQERFQTQQRSDRDSEKSLQKAYDDALRRVEELERELETQRASEVEMRTRGQDKVTQLEQQVEEYTQSFTRAQHEVQELQAANDRLSKDLERQERRRQAAEDRMKELKALETITVQELNNKIAELSQASGSSTGSDSNEEEMRKSSAECERLRRKLTEAEQRINDLNHSIYEYEEQMNDAHQKLQDSLKETTGLLDAERTKNQTLQKEMAARTKQLIAARDRNEQIEAMHKASQQEKQAEITNLTAKLRAKNSSGELENQIRQLQDNIEQKQLRIDTLNSENAALAHQLREKQNYSRGGTGEAELDLAMPYSSRKAQARGILDGDLDDNEKFNNRITPLMALAPSLAISDSWMAKQILSLSRSLDRAATVIQNAWRSHPGFRLILIVYLIFLHLWLFSSFFAVAHHDATPNPLRNAPK